MYNLGKDPKLMSSDIIFSKRETCRLLYLYVYALVVTFSLENIKLQIILIDTIISVDFMPLVGLFGISLVPKSSVTLPITIDWSS